MEALMRSRTARTLSGVPLLITCCALLLFGDQVRQGRNAEAALAQSAGEKVATPVREAAAQTGSRPGWVARYWSVAGANFRPDLDYPQVASGCLRSTGYALDGRIAVSLPHGAHVTYMQMNGQDPAAEADMVLVFRQTGLVDGAPAYSQEVWTSGTPGWGSWGIALDHTLDYTLGAYTLLWSMNENNATGIRFCSAVISYEVPVTNALLPVDLYNP